MKKIFLGLIIIFYTTISFAGGHITKEDKEKAIKCLGHYTSISFIPANEIEAIRLEYALASYKIVREYLLNEKVKSDEINKGTNKELDKLISKPFNEERNDKCNSFIYDLIPGSKDQIEKLRGTLE
ncbi:MAG: hypothetical protein CBC78_003855 [Candidatus Pelagibacter sp. TMED118]|nr:MAG: hypothetical protein CBC78_003855 [Candidatus Pelagibacter sp. TMED118]